MHCPSCSQIVSADSVRCAHCQADLGEVTHLIHEVMHSAPALLEFQPGSVFAGRFLIVEKAAVGGMSVVYKARDRELGGEVALKLLPPALAGRPDFVQRFRREVKVTRDINHPNVCRVYDHGSDRGTLYFFMEWVKGETLRDLLRQMGKLEEGRALEIAEKIAHALEAAHARGVIHRDIKPGNVMIDDRGEVRVLDFGVAGESEHELTDIYPVPVTPRYTAPEQEVSGGVVDQRTDLFALGLLLQEMLSGNPRGPARGNAAAIVNRLRAPNPENRYQTAADVAFDIAKLRRRLPRLFVLPHFLAQKRLQAAIVASLVVGLVVGIFLWGGGGHNPFTPDYLAFSQRGMQYLHDADGVQALDDAAHMFYRSIQDDSTYAPAWAGLGEAYWMRYERTKEQGSRDEAERAVGRAIQLDKKLPEVRLAQARGLLAVRKTADAETILRDLVKEHSDMAAAWALLGRADGPLGKYEDGLKALHRAIELEPANPRFHVQFGVFYQTNHEYAAAEKEFLRAIDLRRDGPTAWGNLGASYLLQNKPDKAIPALNNALKYEPRAATYSNLGTAYYYLHDYARAAESYRHAAELDLVDATYPQNAGDAYRMLGKEAEADSAYVEALRRARAYLAKTPDDQQKRNTLALLYARLNDSADALAESGHALKRNPNDVDALFNKAVIHAVLGQDDAAVDLLERAIHLGLGKAAIVNDPDLSRLRGQPRFERMLALAS